MKTKQIKMKFFVLIVVSALIFRPSEAQMKIKSWICSSEQIAPIVNVSGCFDALKLALASDKNIRLLSRDCCNAVNILPHCLLVVAPDESYNTFIFKDFCSRRFNETKIM
ncbi:uncharacterized protein LOC110229842 [Arabidopsis lyrata subsp. lyrata]|uniref:uncharacterized protein LOC110229842 n=1 Tax=Arabidopsis lyrata subsp. lyrata TaxID=81972 RepID=UPI000A29D7BD|nr:uncharacterized protein LOC110229842 [Arabidopsis lyrata subsp. lyrata]|eukprot:XP_020886521.1 uncharacterized protein LOC110229842 [Arabidopsis lyrata subsp. lyrata]